MGEGDWWIRRFYRRGGCGGKILRDGPGGTLEGGFLSLTMPPGKEPLSRLGRLTLIVEFFYGEGRGGLGFWAWYGGNGSFLRERAKMKKASLIFFSEFSPDHLLTGTGKNEKSIFDIFSRIFSRSYIF